MHRLGRVQAMAGGAGRGQRGHDLLTDQARLAHAGNNHVAAAGIETGDRATKLAVQPLGHLGQGAAFRLNDLPGVAELLEGCHPGRRRRGFHTHRRVVLD